MQIAIKKVAARAMLVGLAALFGLKTAQAHVVLEYQVAPAGSSYKASFKVGHGCGTSPTREISVQIPAGFRGAKPMPKPGWAVTIQRDKLTQPYESHGRTVTEDVVRITWTANSRADMLPADFYDEFVLAGQAPLQAGTVWFPVVQLCEQGRYDWTAIPKPGQPLSELPQPAVRLDILPAEGGGHSH
jgi:periplasmic copper chaperone A